MPSIYVTRRRRKGKDGKTRFDKFYTDRVRFGRKPDAEFLRSTGKTTEREALIEGRRIARHIEEHELPLRGKHVLTLDHMFGRWFDEKGHALKSQKDVMWQVKRLLEGIGATQPVEEISNKDIHAFVRSSADGGASAVTINRCLSLMRSVMRYAAIKWEAPVKTIDWGAHMMAEPKERQIFISPEDAGTLMHHLPRHIALAYAWSLYTGCRLNETETLDWGKVDLTRRVAQVEGKGLDGETRPVWLSQNALAVLEIVAIDSGKRTGLVFNMQNRRKHWEAARKAIGREDLHWHDLRAMTATWARQQKHDLKLIGRALGHTNTATTDRYAHVVDTEVIEMFESLPTIGNIEPAVHLEKPM